MKKYIVLFILLWAASGWCQKGITCSGATFAGAGVAAPSCSTSNDSKLYNPADQTYDNSSGAAWVAQKFVVPGGETWTITLYNVEESDAGSDTGNARMVVMNHDAVNDYPDETSEVAGSAVTLAASSIDSARAVNAYVLSSTYTLSAGTYWVVHQEENSANLQVYYSASTGDRACYSTNSGSTWTPVANTAYNIEVWGCK